MKSNNIVFFLVFFINNIYFHLQARIGCRDNSWHLQKRYDYKQDHPVSCLCPCPAKMGRCFQCLHYHEAQPFVIIKNKRVKKNGVTTSLFSHNIQSICKKLIKKYHNKSSNTFKQYNN